MIKSSVLDPNHLRTFVTLAEELHFGRAAQRLNIAQSSLSAQILRLEDVVGARLFSRHKKAAVKLSHVGMVFLAEARDALKVLARAEQMGRMAAQGTAGPISLGYVFSAVLSGVLPRLLAWTKEDMPQVHLALRQMETPDQISAIADRRLDIGLGRPRGTYPDGVRARVVHREPLVLLLPKDHPLAERALVPIELLREQVFLQPQFDERFGLLEKLESLATMGKFPTPAFQRTPDFVSAACLCAGGYGVVLSPQSLDRIGLDGLVARPIEGFLEDVETVVFWHDDASPSSRRLAASV